MNKSNKWPVAIIGIGNMGGGMAHNLLARGWTVHVHDIDAAKQAALAAQGALAHPSAGAGAAAMQATATIVCVVDAAQTRAVLFGSDHGDGGDGGGVKSGAAHAMQPGHTVFLCPTLAPQEVEAIAAELSAMGLHVIDAPMSGGPLRASDGSMSLMLACADAVFEAQRSLIEALSSKVFRISQRPGDGARTKLVNNLLAGINLVGAAEALAMAQALGLDPAATLAVIEQSSGQSWIGSDRMRRALAGDYAPRAHVTLLEKDTRLAVAAARAVGFAGPLGERASAVFEAAHQAGLAGEDDAALYKLLSARAPRMKT